MELDNVKVENSLGNTSGINLYMTPPFGTITQEECQDLFRQRLEAYAIIESNNFVSEQSHAFRSIKSYSFKTNCLIIQEKNINQQLQDHYSHMLMRLYCIHHSNLWNWFKTCERKLLNVRLFDKINALSGLQIEAILRNFNFDFQRVVAMERQELRNENLIGWNVRDSFKEGQEIFKVKFQDALGFIRKRSVALKDGFAYLTKNEIITVVCDVFERHLDEELNYARRHFNNENSQVSLLLESLEIVYLDHQEYLETEKNRLKRMSKDDSNNPFKIDIDDIEDIAKNHFPPCMRYLHETLATDNHMKHYARMFYATFLKSGGVDVESTTELYRKHFTKKITNERFDRDYKYNIRHLYGLEGHKKSLSCFGCESIINKFPPGPADKHGCPFKHFDESHLKTFLQKQGTKEVDIETILRQSKEQGPTMGCSYFFKSLRGELPPEPISNPYFFYRDSMRILHRPPPVAGDDRDDVGGVQVEEEEEKLRVCHNDLKAIDDFEDDFDKLE